MAKTKNTKQIHQNQNQKPKHPEKQPPSWAVVRSIFTCKHVQIQQQEQQQQQQQQLQKKKKQKEQKEQLVEETSKKCKKMKCSGSLCSNTKVMQKPEPSSSSSLLSPEDHQKKRAAMGSSSSSSSFNNNYGGSSRSMMKAPLKEINGVVSLSCSSSSSFFSASSNSSIGNNSNNNGGSFRGMPFRRFSGCYECRMVVDPVLGMTRDPSLRSTICSCPECGEIFMKSENLELHQAVRHAVSELGPEDTSKNIVEIIFQSSWLKKQAPICKIDRILKVHNTSKTKSNFESYRETIKARATKLPKKHPRCVADGNELLRFHSTTFTCSLGLNGSSNLCNSIPSCNVCGIIKNGFKSVPGKGILTTATSGKAHDSAGVSAAEDGGGGDEKMRAMLVCRVIAGRVKKSIMEGNMDEFDSVGGAVGVYSNLDELYVFNPKAILPCFVVIYRGF